MAGFTITLLSLAATIRGEDVTAETKIPVASFDAGTLLTSANSALPFSPVQLAPTRVTDVGKSRYAPCWKVSLIPLAGQPDP